MYAHIYFLYTFNTLYKYICISAANSFLIFLLCNISLTYTKINSIYSHEKIKSYCIMKHQRLLHRDNSVFAGIL